MYILCVIVVGGILVYKFIESAIKEQYVNMTGWAVTIFAFVYALNNIPVA